jgi:hypothetical protein
MGIRQYDGLRGTEDMRVWSGQRAYDGLGYPPSVVHAGNKNRGYAGLGQGEGEMGAAILGGLLTATMVGVVGGLIFSLSTRILPVKTTTK